MYRLNSEHILVPSVPAIHSTENYSESGFDALSEMQERHFWYRGRHRFLLQSMQNTIPPSSKNLRMIDLGGGTGGWVCYLSKACPQVFSEFALGDSSLYALGYAKSFLPSGTRRYHVDLLNLQMHEEWDIAFLLDVVEHLPDDERALEQAKLALKPGGFLFVTAPAFQCFWSYNDDVAGHRRRYTREDFHRLANSTGLELLDARYFMFFLSPLYILSRLRFGQGNLSDEQKRILVQKHHRIPQRDLNNFLARIFEAEASMARFVSFPWGTSILGVFRRS